MPRRSARLAGSTAVRTSLAADLKLPKTNPAIIKHENKDIDSKGSDEPPVRPQKRSKQSKPNVSSLHPSLQLKNVRGRRGALKDIVEMPLDILHEIFMYLTPVEVLSLSRMCKALRRILMTKSAEYVWKQARLNLDDFPDCPDDLNEVQYASLIFGPLCDYCNKIKGRYYIWSARRRGCGICITPKHKHGLFRPKKGLIRVYSFLGATEYPAIVPVLPSINWRTKTEILPVNDDHSICVVSANQLLKEFKELGKSDPTAQKAWIQKHKDERRRRIAHGRLCEEWLENQNDERAAELARLRTCRYQAIKQRLIDLGWEEELAKMRDIRSWPSVNQPKELTDRVWQNIKDEIIEKLEQNRAQRLQSAHWEAKRRRRYLLWNRLDHLRDLLIKNGDKVILPCIFDLESSGRISTLMEAPTEEDIQFSESLVLESIQDWRQSCDRKLRNMIIAGTTPTSQPSVADPLSLATTFFSCWKECKVFQYPEVLKHACATVTPPNRDCLWNVDGKRVFFDDKAYSLAKAILEMIGLNPHTTTMEDVQWPAFVVECQLCSVGKRRRHMSWLSAVQDALQHNHRGEDIRIKRSDISQSKLSRLIAESKSSKRGL